MYVWPLTESILKIDPEDAELIGLCFSNDSPNEAKAPAVTKATHGPNVIM